MLFYFPWHSAGLCALWVLSWETRTSMAYREEALGRVNTPFAGPHPHQSIIPAALQRLCWQLAGPLLPSCSPAQSAVECKLQCGHRVPCWILCSPAVCCVVTVNGSIKYYGACWTSAAQPNEDAHRSKVLESESCDPHKPIDIEIVILLVAYVASVTDSADITSTCGWNQSSVQIDHNSGCNPLSVKIAS